MNNNMMKVVLAEVLGTFWLVLGGCGSAVLAAGVPDLGIGFAGVSLGLWAAWRYAGQGSVFCRAGSLIRHRHITSGDVATMFFYS